MALPVRRLVGAALALVLAGVLSARVLRRSPPAAPSAAPPPAAPPAMTASLPPSPRPAGPAELALVAPLVPGSALGAYSVREILGVEQGLMRVVCAKDRAVVQLDVALLDPEGVVPPATAGRFAVFYAIHGASPEAADLLARRLAKVIEANPSAPAPPGMTTFTPGPKPGTAL